MKRKPAAQAAPVNECPQCTTPHRCGRQDLSGARGTRCVGRADGPDDCDCLNDCGDDPWLKSGKSKPCARRASEEAAALHRATAGPAEYASWFPINPSGVLASATYRLLERGEVIQRGDEVLGDDTVSWLPLVGWEVGMKWNGAALMPIRRRTSGVKGPEHG